MSEFLQDPMYVYAIAFFIFIALAYKYAKKPALGWIDSEIAKVQEELNQAKRLRAEAETTLNEYKAKQAAALAEAEVIVRSAKESADHMKVQAEADLKKALARHEQQALDRIHAAEVEAMNDVRKATIDLAMEVATKALTQLDEATATKLVDQAIADMPKLAAGTKAKAA